MIKIQEFLSCFDCIEEGLFWLDRGLSIKSEATIIDGILVHRLYPGPRADMEDPLVRETHMLLLDEDGNLLAKSWDWPLLWDDPDQKPEALDITGGIVCEEVPDGTTVVVYNIDGEWYIQSPGSAIGDEHFLDAPGFTFQHEVKYMLGRQSGSFQSIFLNVSPELCFTFKFVTPYDTRTIMPYISPEIYLMGITNLDDGRQISTSGVDRMAESMGFKRPLWTSSASQLSISVRLNAMRALAPGLALRDTKGTRVVIPNPIYTAMRAAKMAGERVGPTHMARIVMALRDKADMVAVKQAYPNFGQMIELMWSARANAWRTLCMAWNHANRQDAKQFAQDIEHHPLQHILFKYKNGAINSIKEGLNDMKPTHLIAYTAKLWEKEFELYKSLLKFDGGKCHAVAQKEEGSQEEGDQNEGSIPWQQEGD